ncbi:hypothetical protein DPMN_183036 [Dreissena polymorpha]|uniref:Uncharacterized protein n=1 Tax=Dreissena polymorpha TaxID=45954 RepID=A0A9D4DHH2_DREPO|nr:hypothetical protein DPMN_183036 [Dreissena polymorpha]
MYALKNSRIRFCGPTGERFDRKNSSEENPRKNTKYYWDIKQAKAVIRSLFSIAPPILHVLSLFRSNINTKIAKKRV